MTYDIKNLKYIFIFHFNLYYNLNISQYQFHKNFLYLNKQYFS